LKKAALSFTICRFTASAHHKEALDSFNIHHCPIPQDRREDVRYPVLNYRPLHRGGRRQATDGRPSRRTVEEEEHIAAGGEDKEAAAATNTS
jgi:hypothetical protein